VVAVLSGAVALFAAGIDVIDLEPMSRGETPRSGSTRAFSETALAEGLAAGRPAFVYFTADWCLTCKVNERRVLSEPAAREALETHGFDVFRADWTRRDEAIRAQLARLGKAGVPAYALYTPDAPDSPRLLSEILTLDGFVTALGEVAESVQRADPGRASTPGGPRIARP
jgi:thiol:disulfide interchange protein DsbD